MNTLPDNLCRWDGHARGHYEVWYFTMNQQPSGCGFWFRYTLEIPLQSNAKPHGELWAFFQDPRRPGAHIALKETYAIESFQPGIGGDPVVQIGQYAFGYDYLSGSLANARHEIRWDLHFRPCETTYQHVPALLRVCLPLKTRVCSPNLDTRFRGTVYVDGSAFELRDEPGCQSHLWGTKHAEAWLWLHCNHFENSDDTLVEALAAQPKILGWTLPLTSSIYVRSQGKDYRFNSLQVRNEREPGQWRFTAVNGQARVRGWVRCAPERFVQVTYHDPDGAPCYCCNSEIADCMLEIEPKTGRPSAAMRTARGTAHFEIAARNPNPAVPLYI